MRVETGHIKKSLKNSNEERVSMSYITFQPQNSTDQYLAYKIYPDNIFIKIWQYYIK